MGSKCWELNPKCIAKGQKQGGSSCPAFNENKGCWQMDWSFIISSLPEQEKACWKTIMKEGCPSCPVFALHKDELALAIQLVVAM